MSEIADLVDRLCPRGVPRSALGDVGEFIRGKRFTKDDYVDSGLGCIHYGEIYTDYGTAAYVTRSFLSQELKGTLRLAQTGDLIIAATGENVKDVCKAVAWLGENEIAVHDDCYIFRHHLDPKYVSYFFQSSDFQAQKVKFASEAKIVRVSGSNMARIELPVPPLAVQREIVAILSEMELLEAALVDERTCRSRQYEFYRDSVLSFPQYEGVRRVTLKDVATLKYGFTASAMPFGEYRFIRITDITASGKLAPDNVKFVDATAEAADYLVKKGDLLMARTGATYGKTMLVEEDMQAVYASFLIRIRVDNRQVLPGYYWHFAQSGHYWQQAKSLVSTAGQPQFNGNVLKTIQVPLPPIEEQERIVTILDKFDALVHDPLIGLSAEIKARRQQYKYYRDRLLSFEEAA